MPETLPEHVPVRLRSLDAYRGLVMLAMASGGLGLAKVAEHFPEGTYWDLAASQVQHVRWQMRGFTFWDMIQPSFMFIVGVAMPFSYANRRARGESWGRLFGHAVVRSVVLILLGIFLQSNHKARTDFTFFNVLMQIGMGYTFVFLVLGRPRSLQLAVVAAILLGYWAAFAAYPAPTREADYVAAELPASWERLDGFAAHWEKNTNAATAFDRWFLNRFPRPAGEPFRFNPEGYTTLNFIPSIATMILGVLAGEWLRTPRSDAAKVFNLMIAGAVCIVIAMALNDRYCPIVKKIWTPSWVLYSASWTLWLLAAFYWIIDVRGYRTWSFPLVVVGVNSIATYVMAQLMKPFVRETLRTHLGPAPFAGPYGPIVEASATLFALWLICYWMYRNKIFLKI